MKSIFPVLAMLMAGTALPSLVQAQQGGGFPETSRRAAFQRSAKVVPVQTQQIQAAPAYSQPAQQIAEVPIVRDRNSGAYLQSVGRRVADRPLACPPRRSAHAR